MDPRHPELAISRLRELMHQYDEIENSMKHATTSAQLAQLEHEGALVVQEICLVAPRIHEAMMQTSRQRRYDLAHGVAINMSKYKVPDGASGEEIGVVEKPVEKSATQIKKETISKKETVIKKTTKKKTAKKKAE